MADLSGAALDIDQPGPVERVEIVVDVIRRDGEIRVRGQEAGIAVQRQADPAAARLAIGAVLRGFVLGRIDADHVAMRGARELGEDAAGMAALFDAVARRDELVPRAQKHDLRGAGGKPAAALPPTFDVEQPAEADEGRLAAELPQERRPPVHEAAPDPQAGRCDPGKGPPPWMPSPARS